MEHDTSQPKATTRSRRTTTTALILTAMFWSIALLPSKCLAADYQPKSVSITTTETSLTTGQKISASLKVTKRTSHFTLHSSKSAANRLRSTARMPSKGAYKPGGYIVVTAYCGTCQKCCGKYALIPDASRTFADGTRFDRAARVCAVDPKVFRFGTVFQIPGMGDYVAHDTGRLIKGNHIDILLPSHHQARQFGRRVYPLEFGND